MFNKAKEMMMRQHQREGGISIGTIVLLNNLMQTHLEEEDQKFVDHFYRKERTEQKLLIFFDLTVSEYLLFKRNGVKYVRKKDGIRNDGCLPRFDCRKWSKLSNDN